MTRIDRRTFIRQSIRTALNFLRDPMVDLQLFLKILFLLLILPTVSSGSDSLDLGSFSKSGLSGWSAKSFQGTTEYRIVKKTASRFSLPGVRMRPQGWSLRQLMTRGISASELAVENQADSQQGRQSQQGRR